MKRAILTYGVAFFVAAVFALPAQGQINVKDYGAVGDGLTDDTAAIGAALSATSVAGGEVYFPAGTYIISHELTIPRAVTLRGIATPGYIDWDNDWQQWLPTYQGKSSVIQYAQGAHGTMLAVADQADSFKVIGLTFRCGQGRSDADVLVAIPPRLSSYVRCRFENLASCWRRFDQPFAVRLLSCRFFGVGTPIEGSLSDSMIIGNSFTSCTYCLKLTSTSTLIEGNRFEWSDQAVRAYESKNLLIVGNVFDSMAEAAIRLNTSDNITVSNNEFYRNGANGGLAGERSQVYVTGQCTGIVIGNNVFRWGTNDNPNDPNPNPRPLYLLEFANAAASVIDFTSNSTYDGYTGIPVNDAYNNTGHVFRADSIDLSPGTGLDGSGDELGEAIKQLSRVLAGPAPCKLTLYQDRTISLWNLDATRLFVVGGTDTPTTVDLSAGSCLFERLDNVQLGTVTYTDRNGVTFAAAHPSGWPQQGLFRNGKSIFNTSPQSASPIGWVQVSSAQPAQWRGFGIIQ